MKPGKLFSLGCLIICFLLVFEYNHIISSLTHTSFEMAKQISFNMNSDFEYRATLGALSGGYTVLEKDMITYYDKDGYRIWSKPLNSQNTIMSMGKKIFVLAEKKAGDIFLLDSKGDIISSIIGLGSITDVRIFNDQYIGVQKPDGSFNMYDKKMNLLGITKLPKGELIAYDVNAKRQDLVMGILDLSRTDFNSKLVIAGFNGTIMSGSNLIHDLIYDIHLTDDNMLITTDHQLNVYDYNSTVLLTVDFDRTINHLIYNDSESEIYYQFTNDASTLENPKSKQTLACYSIKGDLIFDISLETDSVKGMKLNGDRLCIYNDSTLFIYNLNGELLEQYHTEESIEDVLLTQTMSFGIVYDNKVSIYTEK